MLRYIKSIFSSYVLLFSAVPPRQSAEDVVGSGGVDMTKCSLYSRQRTSAAMEDVTYTHWAPQWEDFPVFLSGKLHQLQAICEEIQDK